MAVYVPAYDGKDTPRSILRTESVFLAQAQLRLVFTPQSWYFSNLAREFSLAMLS